MDWSGRSGAGNVQGIFVFFSFRRREGSLCAERGKESGGRLWRVTLKMPDRRALTVY